MIPVDFVGMIGRNPNSRNVYIATGDSGQGITTGALAGMMLADLVQGRESPWEETYSPARKPVAAIKELVSENLTAVKGLAEHLGPGEISSADELGPGQGGLLRKGMHKHAVSRDESGRLRELSGSCTHLGCAVHWNPFEQCWDCPCHGSHFAPDGTVLNAPAVEPLKPA
jgi:Rieske Fe-S protein